MSNFDKHIVNIVDQYKSRQGFNLSDNIEIEFLDSFDFGNEVKNLSDYILKRFCSHNTIQKSGNKEIYDLFSSPSTNPIISNMVKAILLLFNSSYEFQKAYGNTLKEKNTKVFKI